MPLSEQEKKREYMRKRYQENKEREREKRRKYREENKEKMRAYRKSPAGIKTKRKGIWKGRGVVWTDFDKLYERYINATHCEMCNEEFTIKINGVLNRCLEHSHTTGEVRSICCVTCNMKMRLIDAKYKNIY